MLSIIENHAAATVIIAFEQGDLSIGAVDLLTNQFGSTGIGDAGFDTTPYSPQASGFNE